MTYPPTGGAPDPDQPPHPYEQNPYGQNPYGQNPYGQNPYGAQPYPGYAAPPPTNGLAIASLVCSLGGLVTCISAPVGIVLGHVARRQIRQTGEEGGSLATAGLWVGYILTILGLLFVAGWITLFVIFANRTGTTTTTT